MSPEQQHMLSNRLELAFLSAANLQDWLRAHLPDAMADLGAGTLSQQLFELMRARNAQGTLGDLFQALVDHPPHPDIRGMVFALTQGEVEPRKAQHGGWPDVPPHQRWFVNNRPFVNRCHLRSQIQELPDSQGAASVFVIEGDRLSGKSLSMQLVMGLLQDRNTRFAIDIDDYARLSTELNARDLAVAIVGDDAGCPAFDITKEKTHVVQLLVWMLHRLAKSEVWIVIDHCNRSVLTEGARSLLFMLAEKLRDGVLVGVRLVLADFNRDELPLAWRALVRYDRATLPEQDHVEEWLRQMATLSGKVFTDADLKRWAADVYDKLDSLYQHDDIRWYIEFERRLMAAADCVKACGKEAA